MVKVNLTIAVMMLIPITILISGPTYSGNVSAICQETKGTNIYCHEQYNSHSNVETSESSTTSTLDEKGKSNPFLCSDLKCNFGNEYLLEPDFDIAEEPISELDY